MDVVRQRVAGMREEQVTLVRYGRDHDWLVYFS